MSAGLLPPPTPHRGLPIGVPLTRLDLTIYCSHIQRFPVTS